MKMLQYLQLQFVPSDRTQKSANQNKLQLDNLLYKTGKSLIMNKLVT